MKLLLLQPLIFARSYQVFGSIWSIGVMLLLSACSLPQIEPKLLDQANVYEGRFSVRIIQKEAAPSVEQGSYTFYITPSNLYLDIYDPLGNTVARLSQAEKKAELIDNTGNYWSADNMEELARNLFHEDIPLSKVPLWIKGEGFSTSSPLLYDTVVEVNYLDWMIYLTRFEDNQPNQIDIVKISPIQETSLRFIIQSRYQYHETNY